MLCDQADEFGSRVTAGSGDGNPDLSHSTYTSLTCCGRRLGQSASRVSIAQQSVGRRVKTSAGVGRVRRRTFSSPFYPSIIVFIAVDIKKGKAEAFPFVNAGFGNYRFEYWNRFLAPFCPYFLRSFTLESRVSRPSFFSGARSGWLRLTRARAMAWRSAPACPVGPPP